jgi:hypothetical protein
MTDRRVSWAVVTGSDHPVKKGKNTTIKPHAGPVPVARE